METRASSLVLGGVCASLGQWTEVVNLLKMGFLGCHTSHGAVMRMLVRIVDDV